MPDFQKVIRQLGIPEYDQQTRQKLRNTRDTGGVEDDFILAMRQRSHQMVRQSDPQTRRIMILGGMNRPTPIDESFAVSYDRGRPSYYYSPNYEQAIVLNLPYNNYKKSTIIPLLKLDNDFPIKGFFGNFNNIDDWEVFPDNFFDLIVTDFSTSKFFEYDNPMLISVITKKLKPRGSFYIENLSKKKNMDQRSPIRQSRSFIVQDVQSMPFQRTEPVNYGTNDSGHTFYKISKKTPRNQFLRSLKKDLLKQEVPLQETQTLEQVKQKIKRFSKSGNLMEMYYFLRKLPEYRTNPQKTYFQTQKQIGEQDILKQISKLIIQTRKHFEKTRLPIFEQKINELAKLYLKFSRA